MYSIVLKSLPLKCWTSKWYWTVEPHGPFSQELWGPQPRRAQDRDKEQELKWKLAEAIVCCICCPHVGSSLRSIKKPVRRPWKGGAAQLEYDPVNSRIGNGSSREWGAAALAEAGRGTEGNPAWEMTGNCVHGLHGLCCCSGMCCWVGSTHTGTRVSACREMLAWDYSYPVRSHHLWFLNAS